MAEFVDKTLAHMRFVNDNAWFECYLHQSDLLEKPFMVCERHGKGNRDYTVKDYATEVEARGEYDDALKRTKERIRTELGD